MNTPVSQPQANPPQAKPQAKKLPKTPPQAKIGRKLATPSKISQNRTPSKIYPKPQAKTIC